MVPSVTINSKGKKILKAEVDWSSSADLLENYNNKALHAIFNGCDVDHIKLISSCELPRKHEKSFKPTFEGSGDVKRNKLLSLTTCFENLRMLDDESLFVFYTKLCDIVNEFFVLGEKIPKTIPIRKIMRSLPHRFSSKVIAIEEANDLDSMKVNDLMGSLRVFEMTLKQKKKENSLALKIVHEEEHSNEEDIMMNLHYSLRISNNS